MDDYGAINGDELDDWEIDGGAFALDLACDHSIAFVQALELGRGREVRASHEIVFTQALELRRGRELAASHEIVLDMGLELGRGLELVADHQIDFVQAMVIDLLPAMACDMVTAFVQDADLEHAFYGHWVDGFRLIVHAESRGFRVPGERRAFLVPPDDDELVPQKEREIAT